MAISGFSTIFVHAVAPILVAAIIDADPAEPPQGASQHAVEPAMRREIDRFARRRLVQQLRRVAGSGAGLFDIFVIERMAVQPNGAR